MGAIAAAQRFVLVLFLLLVCFPVSVLAKPVALRVVDQNDAEIPASTVVIDGMGTFTTGTTVDLPEGSFSVTLCPRRNGQMGQGYYLQRSDRMEIFPSTTVVRFEWISSQVTIDVVDQSGRPIPGSAALIWTGILDATPTPLTVTLPITDESLYPTMGGILKDGYAVSVIPGRNGSAGSAYYLAREEKVEVLPSPRSYDLIWASTQCPIHVVDQYGFDAPGSRLALGGISYQTGTIFRLPVTDNATYPSISGLFADGYQILLEPGDTSGSGTFQFEVLPGGAFDPPLVTISGKSYGLRCFLNEAPTVDAGPNISIRSSQQTSTKVIGHTTDANTGDLLSCRWLEGERDLLPWIPVRADGLCPLDLGAIPSFSLGNHTLRLEATDQHVVVSGKMVLQIDNSPPTTVCGGQVTSSVWSPVNLHASVADYDGDPLTWAWQEGGIRYGEGTAYPLSGGTPLDLSVLTLPDGLSRGLHTLTLNVDDGNNPVVSCNQVVSVIDTQTPTLAPVATPSILWPPNHQMVDVTIETHATDNSREPVTLSVDQIWSTENPDKDGDGHTIPDWQVVSIDQANGVVRVELRSERSGKGEGRTYTLVITARDLAGNATTANVQVKAPHDKKK
jgi:hypothetical protein